MCYAVQCGTCGKSTWAGCGRHVPSVYAQIQPGRHCLCRQWPGVKLPDKAPSAAAADAEGDAPVADAAGAAPGTKPSGSTVS